MRSRPHCTLLFAALLLTCMSHALGQRPPRTNWTKPDAATPTDIITTYAGNGYGAGTFTTGGYTGDGGPATGAEMFWPAGIAFDAHDNLFIADFRNNAIRRVDVSTGIITTFAGGRSCLLSTFSNHCGDGGAAASAGLQYPSGVAFDKTGNMYIADTTDDAIRKVDASTGIITTIAGTYTCFGTGATQECLGNAGYAGDGGPAASAELNSPEGILLDAAGDIYIADSGSNVIRMISATTGIITTVAGGGSGCGQQTNLIGDGCPATQASLTGPTAIVFDASGNLLIADAEVESSGSGDNLIRKVDAKTGIITTLAGGGSGCTQQTDEIGDGCPATDAFFFNPTGLTFDASHNLYIADQIDFVVRKIDATTGVISTVAGDGIAGFKGTGGPATSAELEAPFGLAFDISGNLYLADEFNNVVRKVTYNTSTPAAATPTFSPAAGTYASTQSVILSDATSGAAIHYTTDGSTPTAGSPEYGGAITVSETTTIKAIAVASGYINSEVGMATYTITPPAATPTFSPAAGTYTSTQTVKITDATSAATIYYTTNATAPTTSSTKYTAAITVSASETIEAIAVATGYSQSAVATATYTINSTGTGPAKLQFIPVTPCRIADTRNPAGPFGGPELAAGTSREFDIPQSACGIPATAVAYSLNVTVVPTAALNYLTMWPSGQPQPYVSTLNSDGRVKADAAITPAGTNGGVSVFVSDPTNVILDIDGYFVPAGTGSALAFYPLTPCRVADTRGATGPLGGPFIPGGGNRAFPVQSSACSIPSTAKAYSLNITAVPHKDLGYLTTWPTGQAQPYVSTLNATTGAITANAAIVPAGSSGDISIFMSDDADVILDVNGYFAPPATGSLSLYTVAPCRVIDTRELVPPFPGTLLVSVEGSSCAPPSTAAAYVLNATVVPSGSFPYLTLWPGGESQPYVSTLNAYDGAITSNMAIVPTNNGTVGAYAPSLGNLILDISSYFAP